VLHILEIVDDNLVNNRSRDYRQYDLDNLSRIVNSNYIFCGNYGVNNEATYDEADS
jgi:hypothetical protein